MAGKLLLVVLAVGFAGAMLLVLRHQRLETAHEMTAVHERIVAKERTLWKLRTDIAERCRPAVIRAMMDEVSQDWTAAPDPEAIETRDDPAEPGPPLGETADDEAPYGG